MQCVGLCQACISLCRVGLCQAKYISCVSVYQEVCVTVPCRLISGNVCVSLCHVGVSQTVCVTIIVCHVGVCQ